MSVLVLGIGNTILSDDGVGIKVAREIKNRIGDIPPHQSRQSRNWCGGIDLAEINTIGISVLDYIRGYDKVVIIDSVNPVRKAPDGGFSNGVKEGVPPGAVQEFSLEEIEKSHPFLSHGINLPLAIEFGRQCGEDIPKDIKIYGIGTKDTTTFNESCTKEVEESIPGIVEYIIDKEFSDVKT